MCFSTVERSCVCRLDNMENGNLFKFAQNCLLSVEVSPNLMDKGARMSAGVNGE